MAKTVIDLSYIYKPHPRQVLFHQSPCKGRLFGGAIRGGKTKALVAEGIELSLDYPGNVGLMARQNLPAFKRTVMVELERYFDAGIWVDRGNGKEFVKMITQHHSTDHYIDFWNGSRIWYTGLGDDTRGLASQLGITLGWFAFDQVEECSEMHFNNMLGRLSLPLKDIKFKYILSANPMPGWVKQRFIESKPDDFVYIPSLHARSTPISSSPSCTTSLSDALVISFHENRKLPLSITSQLPSSHASANSLGYCALSSSS